MRRTQDFTPIPVDIKTLTSEVIPMTRMTVFCTPPLDATNCNNCYSATKEVVCIEVCDQRFFKSSATCISHTISRRTAPPSIHLQLV